MLPLSPAFARGNPHSPLAESPPDLTERLMTLRHHHKFHAAEQLLQPILERDPSQLSANLQMGYLKRAQGEDEDAYAYFKQAAKAHPESLEAQARLVHACLDLEMADEAYRLAEKTLETWKDQNPDKVFWSELHVGLGMAQGLKAKREGFFALTKHGLAVRSNLEKALVIDSNNALAVFALGRYCFNAPRLVGGDPPKGLSMMGRAVKLDPSNHRMRARYIQALKAAHQMDEVKDELARYQADFSDIPGAIRALSEQATGT